MSFVCALSVSRIDLSEAGVVIALSVSRIRPAAQSVLYSTALEPLLLPDYSYLTLSVAFVADHVVRVSFAREKFVCLSRNKIESKSIDG